MGSNCKTVAADKLLGVEPAISLLKSTRSIFFKTERDIENCPISSQNSIWDCFGSFDEQRLFSVKFARFRNFFDFAQIWGILESDKLWEIQCWRVAYGKDESW